MEINWVFMPFSAPLLLKELLQKCKSNKSMKHNNRFSLKIKQTKPPQLSEKLDGWIKKLCWFE